MTAALAERLAARGFTSVHYDRRGRGESGPVQPQDAGSEVQREIEDIAAIVRAVGGTASLFGNSSGGALALWAAQSGVPVSRIAVWEVPLATDDDGEAAENVAVLRSRVAAKQNEAALEHFMKDMPPAWLEGAKAGGAWPGMVALAPSLVADAASLAIGPRESLWSHVTQPVLVLVGEQTLPVFPPAAELLVDTLADARRQTIAGQSHQWQLEAMESALADFFGA